jgi:membrane-bound lytic murein transglycosylase D
VVVAKLAFTPLDSPVIMLGMTIALGLLLFLFNIETQASPRVTPVTINTPLTFDMPIDYNHDVKAWIKRFQGTDRPVFTTWLKRSSRFLPLIQKTLASHGLPQDLAYIAMIESGFSPTAVSSANAVGPWQFIADTGTRYGLTINWWIDERRDFDKSTKAAAKYLNYLHRMFGSWYLAAAGYNTGENRILRLVQKHGTKNFWHLSKQGAMHDETRDYIPKLIAATLIAKAPSLYGFRDITPQRPIEYDHFKIPGGMHLHVIADELGIPRDQIRDMNPELIKGFIPSSVDGHLIRIPKGKSQKLSAFLRDHLAAN